MSAKKDLTGQRFGRLLVIEEAGRAKNGNTLWLCKCTCGSEVTVSGDKLRLGVTKSCGCYQRECVAKRMAECKTTHGMCNTRLYSVWHGILKRTGIHKGADEEQKRDYQDRGIALCEEWRTFENFRDWALSHGYSDDLEIDRIDNDNGYYPENCHFVTAKENIRNRRNTLWLKSQGMSMAEYLEKHGIKVVVGGRTTKIYERYRKQLKTCGMIQGFLFSFGSSGF